MNLFIIRSEQNKNLILLCAFEQLKDDFLNAKELFTSLRELHNAYYLSLIVKLGLQADVLDADGD